MEVVIANSQDRYCSSLFTVNWMPDRKAVDVHLILIFIITLSEELLRTTETCGQPYC